MLINEEEIVHANSDCDGCHRGIGREVGKQLVLRGYRVILTSRSEQNGNKAFAQLQQELSPSMPGALAYHQLDVTDVECIRRLHEDAISVYGAARNPTDSSANLR